MTDTPWTHLPLKLTEAGDAEDRQFRIESDWSNTDGAWADIYVNFGGYFGAYGPHVFFAAPDMAEALEDAIWALANCAAALSAAGIESTIADPLPKMRAALAKAKGATT